MRRGEVWWADLPLPAGRRPVLILTRDVAIPVRSAVTVAPLTRTIRGIPVEVGLGPEDGVPKRCVVNADSIVTIVKARLLDRIATLPPRKLVEVARAVRFALGV